MILIALICFVVQLYFDIQIHLIICFLTTYALVHEIRLPVCWDKTTIVVMNEVRLSPPYLPESVTGGTPPANERVRKVVKTLKLKLLRKLF